MALYFKSKNKNVKIFDINNYLRLSNFLEQGKSINIYLFGWKVYFPNKNGINIAYILYPDCYNKYYSQYYDMLAVASKQYLSELANDISYVKYIPQFTNTKKFYFKKDDKYANNILFVGNNHITGITRKSVEYAMKNNIIVDVYGKWWNSFNSKINFKGDFIANEHLHKYYSSAQIVLNDHMKSMSDNGFISNRVFDVTASRGFLISDYMPEIKEVYGDNVPMYKNAKEFKELIDYYLQHPEIRDEKAKNAQQITLKNFSLEKIGGLFETEIIKLIEKKQVQGRIIVYH